MCYLYLTHREGWGRLAVLPQSDLHDSMALNQSRRNRVPAALEEEAGTQAEWHVLVCSWGPGREHTQTKGGRSLLEGAISHSKNADFAFISRRFPNMG